MNRIAGRTVLITGASAGIGEACARAFAEQGAHLVLFARRKARLERLKGELEEAHGIKVHTFGVDVRSYEAVDAARAELEAAGSLPDVVINNAGKARGLAPIHEGDIDHWDDMIDTNIKGVLYVTRAFLPHMVEQDHGHLVTIGSISGLWLYPQGSVYCATKFATRALNLGANIDLLGTKIRVTSIDPGAVETEFSEVRFDGDSERASQVYEGWEPLRSADVADAVCYAVNAPQRVDVFQLVLMPTVQRHAQFLHKGGS